MLPMNSIKNTRNLKITTLDFFIDTLGTPDVFAVKELFYRDLTLLLEEFQ